MFSTFDPYYQWLGIPPHLQPPHHYRLLGLELFEDHLDVILAAADRQMAHVRLFQLGPYAEFSQKLLNELAMARVCLVTPERKAAYDAELKKKLDEAAPPPPPPPPPEPEVAGKIRLTVHAKEVLERELRDLPSPLSLSPNAPPPQSFKPGIPLREPTSAIPFSRLASGGQSTFAVSGSAEPIELPQPAPWTNEPPYMAEYRRQFFETLIKVVIFAFLMAIGLMLFNALALPWLKESLGKPDAKPVKPASAVVKVKSPSPPLPPLPVAPAAESIASRETGHIDAPPPTAAIEVIKTTNAEPASVTPPVPSAESGVSETLRGEEFFKGSWQIYEDGKHVCSITLQPDFTARDSRHPTLAGTWEYDNEEIRITWNDGWHIVLRREGDKVHKASYSPSDTAEFRPLDEGIAIKGEKDTIGENRKNRDAVKKSSAEKDGEPDAAE